MYRVQYYCKIFIYFLYVMVATTLLSLILIWRGRNIRNTWLATIVLKPITAFYGITWHLENTEILNREGSAVIISNHKSFLDLVGILRVLLNINNIVCWVKKEFLYMGPPGLTLYLMGFIFVDRQDPKSAYKVYDESVEIMKKKQTKVWIFPEGKRNAEKLLPFKKGAFITAVSAQVPIIPVVFSPYYFYYAKTYFFNNGGHVIMRCLEPIPTTGLTLDDVPALQERLHQIVLNAQNELGTQIYNRLPANSLARPNLAE